MALVLKDRVRDTTSTTGTGSLALDGSPPAGYQTFAAIGDGNTTYYSVAGQGTSEWEVGLGTYSSAGPTLARTTILSSSNGGSAVSFSAGVKDVFVTYPSEVAFFGDGATTPTAGGVAYGAGDATAFTSAGTAGQVLVSNGTSAPSFGGVNGGVF